MWVQNIRMCIKNQNNNLLVWLERAMPMPSFQFRCGAFYCKSKELYEIFICENLPLCKFIDEPLPFCRFICEPLPLCRFICEQLPLCRFICEPLPWPRFICEPLPLCWFLWATSVFVDSSMSHFRCVDLSVSHFCCVDSSASHFRYVNFCEPIPFLWIHLWATSFV
jgi:hypothetical protein